VLDGSGQRICAKYFKKAEFPTKAKQVGALIRCQIVVGSVGSSQDVRPQLEFEENLFKKTRNATSRVECEVAVVDPYIAVYRCGSNVTVYVIGALDEVRLWLPWHCVLSCGSPFLVGSLQNELIFTAVLDGLYEALLTLMKCVGPSFCRGRVHPVTSRLFVFMCGNQSTRLGTTSNHGPYRVVVVGYRRVSRRRVRACCLAEQVSCFCV
jgi:hypothetical protein